VKPKISTQSHTNPQLDTTLGQFSISDLSPVIFTAGLLFPRSADHAIKAHVDQVVPLFKIF